ncbi:CatA-like O-acetyltransferase [Terriglobus sp. ADX1]|uniref:CatA-like O-acetyltransferase n=1 Tax=Terriglobus sp. ADX1 TaxID=2794063 RepID=UPI002FE65F9B
MEACRKIDLTTWPRTALFHFFHSFSEPFHGVCIRMDCTEAFAYAKAKNLSIFLTQVHCALTAAQHVQNFRTRILDGEPWEFERINAGCAIGRPNGTIGFAHYPYHDDLHEFVRVGSLAIEQSRISNDLERPPAQNLIRFSSLPWLDFTSISHARNYGADDSAPRITFGKITDNEDRKTLPVSIHVHHGLVDGSHVGEFVDLLQLRFNSFGAA